MENENIVIANPEEFEKKKQKFKKQGKDGFHVVSDFDSTLTTEFVGDERIQSTFELVRKKGKISPEYLKKSYELYDEYHPFEKDPNISSDERNKKMEEWWTKHLEMIKNYGITLDTFKSLVEKEEISMRQGFNEFMALLSKNKVPLLIFSAGIGNIIEEFLKHENILSDNVHIISNFYKFSKNGRISGLRSNIVHSFNKSEIQVKGTPYQNQITKRKNVLLLGDSPGDLNMAEGMNHDAIIKIGFLNEEIERLLDSYKKAYDVVILDDGPMDFVNQLLRELL